ncbi:MAG: NAD(P)-dependent oxidoreductase [Gammaproteobacteria bacterium]|jgi:nucleoside-diphosphate-sugar epimerase|nr:NAD(P)-dependent oxidoreductase [Gammaproteobacteria bacterium]
MKRVLVTGATGFIGRHCLKPLLERGYEVHAVCHDRPVVESSSLTWHRADLLVEGEIARIAKTAKPTHLLHLAWCATPGEFWTSLENLRWVKASIDLLEVFARYGGQRCVVAGSYAEYDWRHGRLEENSTPLGPSTLYGACKHGLHVILDTFAWQSGFMVAWGRVFHVYGPHEHPQRLMPSVCLSLLKGEEARCTHGNQVRDFLYVEDAADAFVALLDSEVIGAVNIGSGEGVPISTVIDGVAKKLGRPHLVRLGAVPARAGDPPELVADVRRLTDELCWRPRVTLAEGIDRSIAWWKATLAREIA